MKGLWKGRYISLIGFFIKKDALLPCLTTVAEGTKFSHIFIRCPLEFVCFNLRFFLYYFLHGFYCWIKGNISQVGMYPIHSNEFVPNKWNDFNLGGWFFSYHEPMITTTCFKLGKWSHAGLVRCCGDYWRWGWFWCVRVGTCIVS